MKGIYLLIGDEAKGPYTKEDVVALVKLGDATLETLFAVDGASDWRPLKTLIKQPMAPESKITAYVLVLMALLGLGLAMEKQITRGVMKWRGVPVPLDQYEVEYVEGPKQIARTIKESLVGVVSVSKISRDYGRKMTGVFASWSPYTAMVEGFNEFGGPIKEEVGVVLRYDGARIAVIVWPQPKEFRKVKSFAEVHERD